MKVLSCISKDLTGFNSFYFIRDITPKMLYFLKNMGVEVPLGIYLLNGQQKQKVTKLML